MKDFNLGHWHGELLFLYGKYKDLREFCLDKDAVYAHVTQNRFIEGFENGKHFKTSEKAELEKWLAPKTEIIKDAFETFELQIPVIFASYLEDAIVSFITVYFLNNEDCICENITPLNQESIKGFVNIGDILKHETIDDLKMSLASRAAHSVASGKSKKKVFNRIEMFAKYKIAENVQAKIISLYDKRNEIVHENRKFELGSDYIEEIYDDCVSLIAELGKICSARNVPYFDPSSLL